MGGVHTPPFFMAITIKVDGTLLPWDWQAFQTSDPLADQPLFGFDESLADGTPIGSPITVGELIVVEDGTSGATNKTGVAVSGGSGSSLTVNLTAADGVVTTAAVNAAGSGYKQDEIVTVAKATAGTGEDVKLQVGV